MDKCVFFSQLLTTHPTNIANSEPHSVQRRKGQSQSLQVILKNYPWKKPILSQQTEPPPRFLRGKPWKVNLQVEETRGSLPVHILTM